MTLFEIISTVFATLGLIGGVFSFFWARASNKKAASAVEAAQKAAIRSASAHEESAKALKRANELTEAMMPKERAVWTARTVPPPKFRWLEGPDPIELINIGDKTAHAVVVVPDNPEVLEVVAEDSHLSELYIFTAESVQPSAVVTIPSVTAGLLLSAARNRFLVRWREEETDESREQVVQLFETPLAPSHPPIVLGLGSSIAPPPVDYRAPR